MNILLLATYYEEETMVAARRWRSLVNFLRKNDQQVTVVTPSDKKREYIGEFGESVFLFKARELKKNKGMNKTVARSKKTIHSPFPYFDISISTWLNSLRDNRIANCCSQTDIIISTYGPAGAMLAGLWFAQKHKKPWVLDFRDSFQVPNAINSRVLTKFNTFVERRIIQRSILSITVGSFLAEYMTGKYQKEFGYIYNGWLNSDTSEQKNVQHDAQYFLYAGAIYEHRLEALKLFLHGLSVQENCILRIRLIKDYSGQLDSWLVENGFDTVVEVLPAISNEDLKIEMQSSIGVLVLEELFPIDWQKGTVTGKLFSLLVSGIPGIVISHPSIELYSLADKANGWFCAYDKNSAETAVALALKCDRNTLAENLTIFESYHFSTQAKKLLELLQEAINEYH